MGNILLQIVFHLLGPIHIALQQAIILSMYDVKRSFRRIALSATGLIVVSTLSSLLFAAYSEPVIIVYVVCLYLSYRYIFSLRTLVSIQMTVAQNVLAVSVEYVGLLVVSTLKFRDQMYEILSMVAMRSVVALFLTFIYCMLRKARFHLSPILNRNSGNIVWTIYLTFLFLSLWPNILLAEQQHYDFSSAHSFIILLFFAFFCFNLFYIHSYLKMTETVEELAVQKMHSTSLEKSLSGLRAFKHNFANILLVINGYVKSNDIQRLSKYMDSLNLEFLQINTIDILNQSLKENAGLYSLILAKMSYAELHNIKLNISVQCEFNTRYCNAYDFSIIIGNLLDNALEAAQTCLEKRVDFEIRSRWDRFLITTANTFEGNIDVEQIYTPGFSLKQGHTGSGLNQIRDIIAKYRKEGYDMKLETNVQENWFRQILTI